MKILVTGGAGYIGSTLVPLLLDQRCQVRILDNLTLGAESLLNCFSNPDFELVVGDIRDGRKVEECLEDVDVVIHLAAIVGVPACKKDPWNAASVNHEATRQLVELSRDKLFVFASTGSNYGRVDGVCTEDTPLSPLSVYGQTKTEAECGVKKHPKSIIFRFATAFGLSPRLRDDLLINNFVRQAVRNKSLLVYEKDNKRTFIHVKDMARAFIFAIEHSSCMTGQIFNVGDEKGNMTKEEVVKLLKSKVDFIYSWGEGWKDEDMRDYVVDYSRIKALGYMAQISVEDGMDEMIKAFKVL